MAYLDFGVCGWLALILLGIFRWRKPAGRRCAAVGVGGLALWGLAPVSALLYSSLEGRYAPGQLPSDDVDAIVVLSAGVYPSDRSEPEVLPDFHTYERCRYAAWLYRNWRQRPILATGGVVRRGENPVVLADVMAQTLAEAGVPREMIWTEGASQSTYENAAFSAQILRAKGVRRIAVVTEAYHMPRSQACFRKQGLDAAAAPVGFRTAALRFRWTSFVPAAPNMRENELCLHEWIGLAWYRLSNRI